MGAEGLGPANQGDEGLEPENRSCVQAFSSAFSAVRPSIQA